MITKRTTFMKKRKDENLMKMQQQQLTVTNVQDYLIHINVANFHRASHFLIRPKRLQTFQFGHIHFQLTILFL